MRCTDLFKTGFFFRNAFFMKLDWKPVLISWCVLAFNITLMAQSEKLPTLAFEQDNNTTATYYEVIEFYTALAKAYPKQLQLSEHGATDAGYPLHVAVLSIDGDFTPASLRQKNKRIFFINNAIHPGEPCGVDATMLLFRDFLQKPEWQTQLKDVVLVTIPFYNIGGGLNRGSYSRANQNGPKAYGFRGNAKNLDLNRDFIKCDSKNAQTFNQIFTAWQPDLFTDNHTSNGADYQYAITLIDAQKDKLDPNLGEYSSKQLVPSLFKKMKEKGWDMTPYVYARNTPDDGIMGFLDLPRYSTGYAALHNTFAFMPETHMLKPYQDRVRSTYDLMRCMIEFLHENGGELVQARKKAMENSRTKTTFALNWTLDPTVVDTINFKGYTAHYKPSLVSGEDRLYYNRNEPFEKKIPHFNTYKSTLSVEKPLAYIIPQAYSEVIERLQWNGVAMSRLTEDREIPVQLYSIQNYDTGRSPYEGHYLHSKVQLETLSKNQIFHKGDYIVYTNQPINRYIVETLEPQGTDSFFAWNFFDGILMQKEYFSDYVFEDLAAELLANDPELKAKLEQRKREDADFAKSGAAQLDFVYRHSPYFEQTFNLYPIGRLVEDVQLPLQK